MRDLRQHLRPGKPLAIMEFGTRLDLDLASCAIVEPIKDRPNDPASGWHWEPKAAFHALARAYGRASG